MTTISELLADRGWLLADGATGTNLFSMGLEQGEAPELWNLEAPDKVRAHYRSFIEAGSDIVLTNTFGGTANRLKLHGMEDRVEEINRIAAALLTEEIAASGRKILNAGSVGPTGDLFEPMGVLTSENCQAAFAAQMRGLKAGGADVAWIETLSSQEEVDAALAAAAEVGLPAVCTLSFDTNGRTMMGVTPRAFAEAMHARPDVGTAPPVAFGGNCGTGAPDLLAGVISMSDALTPEDVVVAKANCGIPEYVDGAIRYSGTAELMADYAVLARDLGVRIIGGCCGTTPEHVRAMRTALETRPAGERPSLERVIEVLGPLTGKTGDLMAHGHAHGAANDGARGGRRRRRG